MTRSALTLKAIVIDLVKQIYNIHNNLNNHHTKTVFTSSP